MRAFDLARSAVNLAAFAIAQGLTVTLDFAIGPNGNPSYLIAGNPALAPFCTAYDISSATDVSTMIDIVMANIDVARVLNDLISAISTPHVSPINCGRAMDGIKHIISGSTRDDKKSWKMMRDALHIEEQYIRYIMTHSTDPRHGRPTHVPASVTEEVCRRSWIIMDRFLEYKKRGSLPLPVAQFPLLK
jgi:hypothetical protein